MVIFVMVQVTEIAISNILITSVVTHLKAVS